MAETVRTLGIDVSISQNQIDRLTAAVPEEMSVVAKLSGIATGLLRELADGGVLLDCATSRQILDLIGTLDQLVPTLEKVGKVRQGGIVAEWRLDPVWLPAIEEIGKVQGRSVQEVVQDAMDYVMEQGWLYQIPAELPKVRFDPEDLKAVAEIIGIENPTGTDIAEWVKAQAQEPILAGG